MSYLEELHRQHKERLGRLAKAGLKQQERERLRSETAHQKLAHEIAALAPEPSLVPKRTVIGSISSITTIHHATASVYDVTYNDIISPSLERVFVLPRRVSMYIAKELTELSHSIIAKHTGNRDHSSCIRGCQFISEQLSKGNAEIAHRIEQIKTKLTL